MTRAAILLTGCALLAACKPEPTPPKPSATPTPAAKPQPVFAKGWSEFWPDAANAISRLNDTGARLGDYKSAGKVYRAEAIPTPVDAKVSDTPNTLHITAEGSKTELSTLSYRLDVTQPDVAKAAAEAAGKTIKYSFIALGLDGGDQAVAALSAGKDASGSAKGADYSVRREALPGGKPDTYRLTVTFNRTGATRPANN
jgi:hypothetical protein